MILLNMIYYHFRKRGECFSLFYKKIIYSILVVCIAFTLVSCSYATDDGSFDNSTNAENNLSFSDDYVVSDGSSSDFNSSDGSMGW